MHLWKSFNMGWMFFHLLSSCSIEHIGSVVGRYTVCQNALLVHVYSIGIDVRPQLRTLGASVGYSHAVYIFDRGSFQQKMNTDHWTFLEVPKPNGGSPIASLATRIGLDIQYNPEMAGVQCGFMSTFVSEVPLDKSATIYFRYNPRAPRETVARIYHDEIAKSRPYP